MENEKNDKMCGCASDEAMAFKLSKLYFEEIARLGFKRKLEFDTVVNAYFYALQRLKNKDKELKVMAQWVEAAEKKMQAQARDELFPSMK